MRVSKTNAIPNLNCLNDLIIWIISSILFLLTIPLSAQKTELKLRFQPTFGTQVFELEKNFELENGEAVNFSMLRFYLSDLEILQDGSSVGVCEKKQVLMDAEIPESFEVVCSQENKIAFNQIRFKLGIDSLTNVSGAMGGDLDPTKGMYWAWQSGYINFKLEGTSSKCPTRNHQFQFHLGGYLPPWKACQELVLAVDEKSGLQIVYFDIQKFISEIDLSQLHTVMRPSQEAVDLSRLLSQSFQLVP